MDEVGSISTISVILAAKGISIKNIGINNNREHGEGALKIAFYDKDSMEAAWKQLDKYKYEMFSQRNSTFKDYERIENGIYGIYQSNSGLNGETDRCPATNPSPTGPSCSAPSPRD